MADNNTYTSKQNIKKYTTQAKFDAIDKSDVPVGTEYNIVGSITESDLDSDLQAKINSTGGGPTYTAGKNIVIDGTTIKTKDDVTFDTAVVNALTVASTGIFTRGPINRVPSINFGTSAEPLSATGIYSFANIFTTYNETKTTYNFKIPSVGGYVDIRFPNVTYGNLVAQEQLKTLFGNQSLVGSGNIDLYRHTLTISGTFSSSVGNFNANEAPFNAVFISSNNLNCGSIADLKTVLGNEYYLACMGAVFSADLAHSYPVQYITSATLNLIYNGELISISITGAIITDTVTAI